MPQFLKRLRPVDYLPWFFVLTTLFLTLASGNAPRFDHESLGAWAIFTLIWVLIVALPSFVRFDRRFFSADFRNLPGHTLIIVLVVVLLFTKGLGAIVDPLSVAIAALIGFLVYGLGRNHQQFSLKVFLYRWSPLIVSFYIYENLRWFVSSINPRVMDDFLARLDLAIFGVHLTLVTEKFQSPWLSEWFSFHYAAYFLYPLTAATLLYYHRHDDLFENFILAFCLTMYLGFLGYVAIPAVGPISGLLDLYSSATVPGMSISDFRYAVVEKYRYLRDAFPSLHTAISLLCVLSFRKPYPRLFKIFVFMEVNLLISTIYLRMHYTVDLVAGAALGIFAFWVAPRINGWAGVPRMEPSTPAAPTDPAGG